MHPRDKEKVERLRELCEAQGTIEFELSTPVLMENTESELIIKNKRFPLSKIGFEKDDIDRCETLGYIEKLKKVPLRKLDEDEFSRTRYRVYLFEKPKRLVRSKMSRTTNFLALGIGILVALVGVVMALVDLSFTGYLTSEFGYYYDTLTPAGAIIAGLSLVFISFYGFYVDSKEE